jgi:hypothetical protein
VDRPVAGFIYVLLILVTALFVIRVSPIVLIKKIWALLQTEKFDTNNVTVMKQAAETVCLYLQRSVQLHATPQ